MRYLVLHLEDAQIGGTGGQNQNVICLDPPCLTSTSRMSETSRGSLGPCMRGCMSREVGQHFQASIAGPVSLTRQRLTFSREDTVGALPLSTVGSANMAAAAHLKGGSVVKLSGRRNWQKRPQVLQAPASPASKTPTLWSVVNMPSGTTSAQADGGAMTASLDLGEEEGKELFHEFNQHTMQQCGLGKPSKPPQSVQPCPQKGAEQYSLRGLSPEWQTIRWLQQCKSEIMDDEVVWWALVNPLTDGSDATSQALARRLVAN